MTKYFVHLEMEPGREKLYRIEEEVTVGRAPENDICLNDLAVSRRHARIYLEDGKVCVKDLGSLNGTYVNQKRIGRWVLARGDKIRVGAGELKVFREDDPIVYEVVDPITPCRSGRFRNNAVGKAFSRSKRLEEAIGRTPVFSRTGPGELKKLARKARLLLFDAERDILRHEDPGVSLFLILEGKVEMVAYDNDGREMLVSYFTKDQFFGETAFLSGKPRKVTVRAVEETLLCELDHDCLREAVMESPEIRSVLESCCRDRLARLENAKGAMGFVENRMESRVRVEVPVRFRFRRKGAGDGGLLESHFHGLSVNISSSGIRIAAEDPLLPETSVNEGVAMRIELPRPWTPVEIDGCVKRVVTFSGGKDRVLMGIKFENKNDGAIERLESFLYG